MRLTEGFQLLARASEGVVRLRKLILSLAIQGKLAPQDKNDEPASRLLDKISAEKNRLIAEGKIKQDKLLPAITGNDSSFEFPEQWEWVRAQDICTVITDGDHQPPPKASEGVPFLVIGDVRWGSLDVASASRFVPDAYFDQLDWSKKPLAGDILYTTVGSFGIPVQVTEERRFCFQRHIGLFRPAQTTLQPFLNLVLMSDLVFQQASARATGIAQKTVPLSALRDFKIPLPPLAEQARIVAKVDELMRLCDELETRGRLEAQQHARLTATLFDALAASESSYALAENWARVAAHFDLLLDRPEAVDALEQTILQLAVRGLLVKQEPNDEPAGELLKRIQAEKNRLIADAGMRTTAQLEVPEEEKYVGEVPGWQYCRLGNLARFIDYRGRTPQKVETGIPLITAKNVRSGFISREPREYIAEKDYSAWMTRGFPRVGDLLFTTEAPLGNIALIDITERFALAQRVICFQLHDLSVGPYLRLAIMSAQVQEQLSAAASGMTATGIKASRLKEIPIAIPPLAEQRRIVARVDELRRLCIDLRERLIASQMCQTRLAEALVEQTAATSQLVAHMDEEAVAV